jgi:hypothetical protein
MGCVMSSSTASRTISAWPDFGFLFAVDRQARSARRPIGSQETT